jgi:DNA adenine methylase
MRYVGGKTKISKWVAENVVPIIGDRSIYLEPFVGSGGVFVKLAPHFQTIVAADIHPDLILMWQALVAGWDPPVHVTKEEYLALKAAAPSALRGLVGFGASFGGKWFGGYVDTAYDAHWDRRTKPFLAAARESVLKALPVFKRALIQMKDYHDHRVTAGTVIYCVHPYKDTLGYGDTGKFNTEDFWRTAKQWAEIGALVVVSEAQAPSGWRVLAQRERKTTLHGGVGSANTTRNEALYVVA